jgi:hypothetical protein
MEPVNILGIDLGISTMQIQRLRADRESLEPLPAEYDEARNGAVRVLLEVDALCTRLHSFGNTAQRRLLNSVHEADGLRDARFVQAFKPYLQLLTDFSSEQGNPGSVSQRVCRVCNNRSTPGQARFCQECGSPFPSLIEEESFACSEEEALRYCSLLLSKIAASLAEKSNGVLTADNGLAVYGGVPVDWNTATRERYREMISDCFGGAAVELVTEPEAALLYHLVQRSLSPLPADSQVLVIDFGSATTDFVLGKVVPNGYGLIYDRSPYREHSGGNELDRLIARYLLTEAGAPVDAELSSDLLLLSRRFKEQFSEDMALGEMTSEAYGQLTVGTQMYPYDVALSRALFGGENLAGKLIRELPRQVERALSYLGARPEEVKAVFTTGGGANWYFVQEALTGIFGSHLIPVREPQLAIARGLALTRAAYAMAPQPQPGKNIIVDLTITPVEAAKGCTKTFMAAGQEHTVVVPSGVDGRKQLHLEGRGEAGLFGGPAGQLIVKLTINRFVAPQAPNPSSPQALNPSRPQAPERNHFHEPGRDLTVKLALTYREAQHGCTKIVVTPSGEQKVSIPVGSRDGDHLYLIGHGLSDDNGTPGNLTVVFKVQPVSTDSP